MLHKFMVYCLLFIVFLGFLFSPIYHLPYTINPVFAQSAEELTKQLQEKQEEITKLEAQLDISRKQEKTLKQQLDIIDGQTKVTSLKIEETSLKIEKLEREIIDLSGRIDQVNKREKVAFKVLRDLADDQLFAMQKFALRRYNPYQDMGGDQSFSMALLDGKDSGFVITSLHTRSGTRVYAKMVESGTPKVSLSGDERETLDSAMRFSK